MKSDAQLINDAIEQAKVREIDGLVARVCQAMDERPFLLEIARADLALVECIRGPSYDKAISDLVDARETFITHLREQEGS